VNIALRAGAFSAARWHRALGRLPAALEVYGIEGAAFVAGDRLTPSVERAVQALAAQLGARR
jgi:hypothetical protein